MTSESGEFWMPWTAQFDAEITLDGLKINEVFLAIKSQLEILRRQQAKILEFGNVGEMIQKVENLTETVSSITSFTEANSDNAAKIQMLEEKNVALVSAFDKKLVDSQEAMEVSIIQKIDKATKDEREIRLKIFAKEFNEKIDDSKEILEFYIKNHTALHNDLTEYIQNQVEKSMTEMKNQISGMDNKFNSLRDVVTIQDLRIRSTESKLVQTAQLLELLRKQVEDIPENYLNKINNKLDLLEDSKASKNELLTKADLSMMELKADVEDINKLNELTSELDRRINRHSRELQEGFKAVNKRLEKKTEKIARWCLQHVLRELALNNNHDTGTDIGRVKCLVCDQVVNQNTETDIVHSGPGFKNTIKPFKAPRSMSPSPERKTNSLPQENQIRNHLIIPKARVEQDTVVDKPKAMMNKSASAPVGVTTTSPKSVDHIKINGSIHLYPRGTSSNKSNVDIPKVQLIESPAMEHRITDDLPSPNPSSPTFNHQFTVQPSLDLMDDPDYMADFKYRYVLEHTGSLAHIHDPEKSKLRKEMHLQNDVTKNPMLAENIPKPFKDLESRFSLLKSIDKNSSSGKLVQGSAGLKAFGKISISNSNQLYPSQQMYTFSPPSVTNGGRPTSAPMRRLQNARYVAGIAK